MVIFFSYIFLSTPKISNSYIRYTGCSFEFAFIARRSSEGMGRYKALGKIVGILLVILYFSIFENHFSGQLSPSEFLILRLVIDQSAAVLFFLPVEICRQYPRGVDAQTYQINYDKVLAEFWKRYAQALEEEIAEQNKKKFELE